jgi:hypothetical protein
MKGRALLKNNCRVGSLCAGYVYHFPVLTVTTHCHVAGTSPPPAFQVVTTATIAKPPRCTYVLRCMPPTCPLAQQTCIPFIPGCGCCPTCPSLPRPPPPRPRPPPPRPSPPPPPPPKKYCNPCLERCARDPVWCQTVRCSGVCV